MQCATRCDWRLRWISVLAIPCLLLAGRAYGDEKTAAPAAKPPAAKADCPPAKTEAQAPKVECPPAKSETKAATTETKPEDEAERQAKIIQEQYAAEQRALEKQLREDPAWKPTHTEVGVIHVGDSPKDEFVHSFCLDADDNVLVGCGGKRQKAVMNGNKMEITTEEDPSELRLYSPDGKLKKSWKVGTEPQAICMLPDGTIFVAGDGKLLRLDAEGKQVAETRFPSLPEEKPADKKDTEKKKPEKKKTSLGAAIADSLGLGSKEEEVDPATQAAQAAAMARYRRAATGIAVTDTEVFFVSMGTQGYGYSVWRLDHDFKSPKEIITGLAGCCGQMDIQAVNGELLIPENGRHKVHRYDREGKKLASFGKNDRKAADGFGGCCEPKNLCISGGDIFTAESGEPVAVKRFAADGTFKNVVAIAKYKTGCVHVCVSVSQDGRVYLLNPGGSAIHIFADQRKSPSHQFARKIIPGEKSKTPVAVTSFCLDAKGNVLAACNSTVRSTKSSDKSGDKAGAKPAESTTVGDVRMLSPEGKLLKTWKLGFAPQAINRAPDGSIYVGGSGKMAHFSAKGKVLKEVDLPTDAKHLPPEEEKKLREELKTVQADYMKAIQDYQPLYKVYISAQQDLVKARNAAANAKDESAKKPLADKVEKAEAEVKKAQTEMTASRDKLLPLAQSMQKLYAKVGAPGQQGTVTGIAASKRDMFICRTPAQGYGYEVWRTDLNFKGAKKLVTGLAGCCGQMDVQADGDELWIPENARHQVHRYDRDGKKLATFGKNDRTAIDGFGGCCEPKNIRIAGEDIFTAESTSPVQIKRFSRDGQFQGLVATGAYKTGCVRVCVEVSADKSRVFCLSPGESAIYVFEKGATPVVATAEAAQSKPADNNVKEAVQ